MSTFAIGDIHGHCLALERLLAEVPIKPSDRVVFLGDYVNKGPDAKGVIDLLLEFKGRCNAVFLRGNHDQMMIDARRHTASFWKFAALGGRSGLRSYGPGTLRECMERVPRLHWKFLEKTCRNYFETKRAIFVHGGIRRRVKPEEEDPFLLQSLKISYAQAHRSGKIVICGHSAQASGRIVDLGHTICIDTGIAKGGYLTCLNTKKLLYWQVSGNGRVRCGQLRKP